MVKQCTSFYAILLIFTVSGESPNSRKMSFSAASTPNIPMSPHDLHRGPYLAQDRMFYNVFHSRRKLMCVCVCVCVCVCEQ